MNHIEDARIRFYLEHQTLIREWAGLQTEVNKFAAHFYRSLKGDLDAALRSGKIADDDVESFLDATGNWPGVGLRRHHWPNGNGDEDPQLRLEWNRTSACFSPDGDLTCGVRTTAERYRQPFSKERRPAYPRNTSWWPAYTRVGPPDGRFWEGEGLREYRDRLVETILQAWKDLAPLVDEAVAHSRSPSQGS